MRSGTRLKIEIESVDGSSFGESFLTTNADEAFAFVSGNLQPGFTIVIACIGSGVDYGNFVIDVVSTSVCNLRALEHRGFCFPGASAEQTFDALKYWLPQQERTPALTWQDE